MQTKIDNADNADFQVLDREVFYKLEDEWVPAQEIVEFINVKGLSKPVQHKIYETHRGYITFNKTDHRGLQQSLLGV